MCVCLQINEPQAPSNEKTASSVVWLSASSVVYLIPHSVKLKAVKKKTVQL